MSLQSANSEQVLSYPRVDTSQREPRPTDPDLSLYQRVHGLDWWKRAIDLTVSTTALVLTAPLSIAAAAAVKLSSPGPAFFSQERVGLDRRVVARRRRIAQTAPERRNSDRRRRSKYGKPFTMYKFRTMRTGAERDVPQWASADDERVTRVGKMLRKTRIDEIPQFVNVLRGDMSIVGPRPERAYFIAKYEREVPDFKLRLRTKPGITGLAQVHLGYCNSLKGMGHKLHLDLEYIRRQSPMTDLRILAKTVGVVLTGKGAY